MGRMTDLLALSIVPRWSIVAHSRLQTVADHTFRVMVIAAELAHAVGIHLVAQDLAYILEHDAEESRTGDIPAPAKTQIEDAYSREEPLPNFCPWPHVPKPSREAFLVFRLSDLIEAHTWIAMWGKGRHAIRVADGVYRIILQECPPEWKPAVVRVIEDIRSESGR